MHRIQHSFRQTSNKLQLFQSGWERTFDKNKQISLFPTVKGFISFFMGMGMGMGMDFTLN